MKLALVPSTVMFSRGTPCAPWAGMSMLPVHWPSASSSTTSTSRGKPGTSMAPCHAPATGLSPCASCACAAVSRAAASRRNIRGTRARDRIAGAVELYGGAARRGVALSVGAWRDVPLLDDRRHPVRLGELLGRRPPAHALDAAPRCLGKMQSHLVILQQKLQLFNAVTQV